MIGAVFAFFGSPLVRIAGCVLGAAVLAGAVVFWFHEHDQRVLAEQAAREAAAVAAEQIADMRRAVDAANAEAQAATERAAKVANTKTEIARAPVTVACAASPAVRVVLDQLRAPGAGNSAAGGSGGAAGMPAPAGSARPAAR